MASDFWNGKKVFLTGHTGFKGGWLSLWLQELGAFVCGYSLAPPTKPNFFETTCLDKGMQSIIGDILDLESLQKAIDTFQPEIVIHLAAQSLVLESYENPIGTYATNVMGTVNILESIRRTKGIRSVIVVTSDKCYENRERFQGYREDDPMGGYDPYSSSKGCAELVVAAYRRSYFNSDLYSIHGVALATARAGNVIGGGDWAKNRLVPDLLRAFVENKTAIVRNSQAIRPWQHVLEPLSGYLLLAESLYHKGPAYAEAWNFGPDDSDSKTVEWVADQLKVLWGASAQWKQESTFQSHEASSLKLDSSKARTKLNWRPRLSLEEALEWTVTWAKSYQLGENTNLSSRGQIEKFMALKALDIYEN